MTTVKYASEIVKELNRTIDLMVEEDSREISRSDT